MVKIKEVTFEFAKYITGEVFHITSAQSGANGYYCIGCSSEMIAYLGRIRQPHFRHHPNDVDKSSECTWSDETYRHKIAKEILQRLKEVRVPKVSIGVPKEYGGGSITISPSRIVKASSVLIERYIYEDEYGQVKFGKSFDSMGGKRHLLVKPDVLFLDEKNKPILIIELCATHKTDEEKRMRLMHLGVDAIELLIPKAANPQDIEKNIVSSNHSKWLYNNEQAKTKFNPATHLISNASTEFNREPGDIPKGETIQCRTFRVRECIRGIKKFMGSSDFAEGRRAIEEELSRVEGNAERERKELADLIERARAEAEAAVSKFIQREQQKAKELDSTEARFGEEAEAEERHHRDLEERYHTKRDNLIREHKEIQREEDDFYDRLEGRRKELVERIRKLRECREAVARIRRAGEEHEAARERVINIQNGNAEEERRIKQEESQAAELRGRREKDSQGRSEAIIDEFEEIRRMEEDIREMERQESHIRKLREELVRIKDRAFDARFNKRD
ncbi:competence protein CoiA family protein [Pontibacter amylolyticus]|nr:competence protein CoiA family protein [Pontibacter amylolyticus]